jgi:hypothetical protein
MEIWPIDKWSRKIICDCLEKNNVRFEYSSTTMGEPALRFSNNKDYELAYQLIKEIEIEN